MRRVSTNACTMTPAGTTVRAMCSDALGVQLVFVGGADGAQLRRLLEPFKAMPALTISDAPGAMEAGSVINFVLVDNRLRFEVSLGNAERHGLKVSARLLAVAQRVDTGRRE